MKYLKHFENRDIIIDEYFIALEKLVKYYFKEYKIFSYFENNDNYRNYQKITLLNLDNKIKEFLVLSIEKKGHLFNLYIQSIYSNIDLYEKTNEFVKYFSSLALPLSYSHDSDVECFLVEDNLKKLIKLLSIDEYKIRVNTNKYNL